MVSRPHHVIRSSELQAQRGKSRTSARGELDDLKARLVKAETQAFRNLRGDAASLATLAGLESDLSSLAAEISPLLALAADQASIDALIGIDDLLFDLSAQAWSLADDAAVALAMPTDDFVGALVWGSQVNTLTANPWGLWFVRGSASPAVNGVYGSGAIGTQVDLSTGTLTGTTGVDGNFTISPASGQLLWLENRSGSARGGKAVFFGRSA